MDATFLRGPIQRYLESTTGLRVRFGELRVAMFRGSVEARAVTLAPPEGRPILEIDRVEAEVDLGRALRGEAHIERIAIERPVLTLSPAAIAALRAAPALQRRTKAKTGAPPTPPPVAPADGPPAEAPRPSSPEPAAPARSRRRIRIGQASITGGVVRYAEDAPGGPTLTLEALAARVTPDGEEGHALTLHADRLARAGGEAAPREAGPLRATGWLGDLAGETIALGLDLLLGPDDARALTLRGSGALTPDRAVRFEADGAANLATLLALLPLRLPATRGNATFNARGSASATEGLTLEEAILRIEAFTLAR